VWLHHEILVLSDRQPEQSPCTLYVEVKWQLMACSHGHINWTY